jgi:hypothetical protein
MSVTLGRNNVVPKSEDEQDKPMPAISDETMQYWREPLGDLG